MKPFLPWRELSTQATPLQMKLCTCATGDYPDALQSEGYFVFCIVLTVFLALWWAWQSLSYIRRMGIRSLLKMDMPLTWRRTKLDNFDQKVMMRFHKTRVERYVWFLNVLRWTGVPSIVCVTTAVLWKAEIDGIQMARFTVDRVLPEGLVVTSYALLFSQFPHVLTKNRADILFALLFLCLGFHTAFTTTTYEYVSISRLCNASQLVVAIAMGDSSKFIPLNIVNTIWQFLVVYWHPELHEDWFSICTDLCTGSNFVTGVGLFIETWLMAEARAFVREMEASSSEASVQNLLTVMCDAVVSLSPDLKLREHCPQLHSLLCRGSPLPAGTDTPSFMKYLREADVPRLCEFLARAGGAGEAASIHVHLLDAIGNGVPVQLFHTCLPVDSDSADMNHLIGICEDRNTDVDYFPQPVAPVAPTGVQSAIAVKSQEVGDVLETGSQASSLSLASSAESYTRKPVIYVNPVHPFGILQALPKVGPLFNIISLHVEGCNLADWIEEPLEEQEASLWLEAGIDAVKTSGQSMEACFGPLRLRPPTGLGGKGRNVTLLVSIANRPNEPPQVEIEIKPVKGKRKLPLITGQVAQAASEALFARSSGGNTSGSTSSRGADDVPSPKPKVGIAQLSLSLASGSRSQDDQNSLPDSLAPMGSAEQRLYEGNGSTFCAL